MASTRGGGPSVLQNQNGPDVAVESTRRIQHTWPMRLDALGRLRQALTNCGANGSDQSDVARASSVRRPAGTC